ncbi:MAG TPA: hypothetical protein VNF75_09095 [Candidatus Dormibacteraeota bacterium]|nr:hypothetical protein [Candidatus Dormibacteraeota bacterium]
MIGAILTIFAGIWIALLASFDLVSWLNAYMLLCLGTVLVVRVVTIEPGAILRSQANRRVLVIAIAGVCATAVILSQSLQAYSPLLILLLVFFDVLLARATQRLATAYGEAVDEGQEAFRNRSHRIAFWVLAAFIVAVIVGPYLAADQARAWLADGIGVWIVLAELVFFLPAMIIAWSHPNPPPELVLQSRRRIWFRRATAGLVGLAVTIPVLASLALPVAPISTQRSVRQSATATSQRYSLRATETVGWFLQA